MKEFLLSVCQFIFQVIQWLVSSQVRIQYVFIAALAFIGGCYVGQWKKELIGEKPGMGWIDDPDYVAQAVKTFRNPYFGDAAKGLIQQSEDKDAFLWKFYEQVHGHPWMPHDQNGTGCCVGEGFSAALEILQCVEIKVNGESQEAKPISAAAMYSLAREVGGMLGRGDGSTGADAAKACMDFGAISCEEAKDDNTTGKEHAALAKKWGRSGLPENLKQLASQHRIKTASLVRTPEEVRAALTNGYPVAICSSVGFEPFRRDKDGFCRPGGSWPHCMCIAGYRADRKAFLVLQSWGTQSPPGPKSLDQPDGSFWIDWSACQRIVRAGESYALSTFDGYKPRNIDNFIQVPNQRPVYVRVQSPIERFQCMLHSFALAF